MDENLITEFMNISGVDRERAEFYLASSSWQLEVALANFYECSDQGAEEVEAAVEWLQPAAPQVENSEQDQDQEEDLAEIKPEESEPRKMDSKSKPKDNKKFATIASLKNKESSSDEEEGQAFYAGGSEHSGQQVLGPSKKKKDIITDMFKSCAEQAVPPSERTPQQRPSTFTGTGYKLGQTSSDTEVIPSGSASESSNSTITLKLWRDGFTINDQEIRPYSDPKNREFMEAIKREEIPMELRQEVQGAEVHLNMEDHRFEEYVPPKPQVKAFTGKGHKLGSPSPATVGMTVPTDSADQAANESQARRDLNVDTNNPVTTIQIRLADGTNIREQFNLTHTVGDIRRYIRTMRPQFETQEFIILTSYPTKELADDEKTIEQAGLSNSAIMQRLK